MNRWVGILFSVIFFTSAMTTVGCTEGNKSSDRLDVTVSIPPQQWLVEQIGGANVRVNCLLRPGSDPENQEPSIRQMADMKDSQIYFTLGGLPFEEAIIDRMRANMPHLLISDTSEGMEKLSDEAHCGSHEGHSHHHESFDPHIWTSLENCRVMAANVEKALSNIDPENAQKYNAAFLKTDSILSAYDREIKNRLDNCKKRTFMAWHPSLGYFARDYRLHQISVQQSDKEVSPRQLAEAIDHAKEERPVVLFYDIAQQGNETSLLSSDLGLPVCPLRLMDYLFIEQLLNAASAISSHQ